jgi:hypothetical protein
MFRGRVLVEQAPMTQSLGTWLPRELAEGYSSRTLRLRSCPIAPICSPNHQWLVDISLLEDLSFPTLSCQSFKAYFYEPPSISTIKAHSSARPSSKYFPSCSCDARWSRRDKGFGRLGLHSYFGALPAIVIKHRSNSFMTSAGSVRPLSTRELPP